MIVLDGVDEIRAARGTLLGTSDWLLVDQDRVDRFADATGDHQWIHVDVDRARSGPFGGTIAHGYLALSLLPALAAQVYDVRGFGHSINYGLERVRFPQPLKVGTRVRSTVAVGEITDVPAGLRLALTHTMNAEGEAKPVVVAEQIRMLVR